MKLFLVLYVDGALIFNIREEAMKDSKNTFQQIKKLGLNMHVGKKGKKTKTEDTFFSSRSVVIDWVAKETSMKEKTILASEFPQVSDPSILKKSSS